MIIRIETNEGCPTVSGVPEGNVVMFLAKLYGLFEDGSSCDGNYCVIYGPETCLPGRYRTSELWDAKVALGKEGAPLRIWEVKHGHKNQSGGGFVEFGDRSSSSWDQIFFRLPGNAKKSTFNGEEIEEVYSAL